MTIWVDVYDPSGNRLGNGPVQTVKDVSVSRKLDGVGRVRFTTPATDERVNSLLALERRINVWSQMGDSEKRLITTAIISGRSYRESPGGISYTFDAVDILDELSRYSVWLGQSYKQRTLKYVIDDLLPAGWMAVYEQGIDTVIIDLVATGVSVLKAIRRSVEIAGGHIRLGDGKTLEVGYFGAMDSRRVNKVTAVTPETLTNDNLLLVQQLSAKETSKGMVNRLGVIGSGEGTAALTLEHSTRTAPYQIKTQALPDGSTLYYLEDTASIATYGVYEKLATFKQIEPVFNTAADIINAANALYDLASTYLSRHSVPQKSYSLTLKNVSCCFQVGDKLRIKYRGKVTSETGQTVDYVNLDGDFYVMDATETVNLSGSSARLDVSNVDRVEETEAEVVLGAIEDIQLRNVSAAPTQSVRSYVYDREIADGFPAEVPIEFTDATLNVDRIRMRIKTSPFRSTAKAVQAHQHVWAQGPGQIAGSPPSSTWYQYSANDAVTGNAFTFYVQGVGSATQLETFIAGGGAALDFGITDDTQYPGDVTVWFEGNDVTNTLFGVSTIPGGNTIDEIADLGALTDMIVNSPNGLRKVHLFEIRCASGQGRVEVTIEIAENARSIRLR